MNTSYIKITIQNSMMADSRHRYKTFKIEKKLSESRNKNWNPEKYFSVKKNHMKSRKKLWNREKQFKIKKNISESRKKI